VFLLSLIIPLHVLFVLGQSLEPGVGVDVAGVGHVAVNLVLLDHVHEHARDLQELHPLVAHPEILHNVFFHGLVTTQHILLQYGDFWTYFVEFFGGIGHPEGEL
jgi:hypothetical protein